jgi:predicted dehydrogenase
VSREESGVRLVSDATDLIADPGVEIVVVASPNDSHAHWTRAAIEAGKHVIVEKPFVLSLSEARVLVSLAERRDVLLSVFHNRRWDSDYLSVRQAIEEGLIGRVVHFESHFDRFRPEVRPRWRESAGPGAGIWYDLGPHLIDQALLLFGLPSAITADIATMRDRGQSDDWANVTLHYPGKRVLLHASMLVAGGSARFTVHGDRGSLTKRLLDPQENQLLAGVLPGGPDWGYDPDPVVIWQPDGSAREFAAARGDQSNYYRAIEAAVRGVGPNPTPANEMLAVMAVIEAGIDSSRRGMTIPLSFPNESDPRAL